jgi:membrane fusion protein, heavy metal efflux system
MDESRMPIDPEPESASRDSLTGRAAIDRGKSSPQTRAKMAALLVLAALLGAGAYRVMFNAPGYSESPSPAGTAVRPLIRSGDTVTLPEGSPLRTELAVAPVVAKDIKRDLVLPAIVEADPARLIKVAPPLAGRVTQLKVGLGERVHAGQQLLVIDSPDLGTAYSDYDRAKVLLALAGKTRDRLRALEKIGGAAMKDLQQAETDYITAEVELQRAGARLKQIGVEPDVANKSRTVTVVAPMAGSIIDLGVAPGEYWNDPTAAMMTIADLKTVWVTASVPEKDTSLVSRDQPVAVSFAAYPAEAFSGKVLFVSDVLDQTTRRTKVTIAFDNPDTRLRPGMFASVTFYAPVQKVPVVPTSALVLKDDETRIFIETAPWTFEAHDVDIGFQQGSEATLTRGVNVGDRIVVRGGALLSD